MGCLTRARQPKFQLELFGTDRPGSHLLVPVFVFLSTPATPLSFSFLIVSELPIDSKLPIVLILWSTMGPLCRHFEYFDCAFSILASGYAAVFHGSDIILLLMLLVLMMTTGMAKRMMMITTNILMMAPIIYFSWRNTRWRHWMTESVAIHSSRLQLSIIRMHQ